MEGYNRHEKHWLIIKGLYIFAIIVISSTAVGCLSEFSGISFIPPFTPELNGDPQVRNDRSVSENMLIDVRKELEPEWVINAGPEVVHKKRDQPTEPTKEHGTENKKESRENNTENILDNFNPISLMNKEQLSSNNESDSSKPNSNLGTTGLGPNIHASSSSIESYEDYTDPIQRFQQLQYISSEEDYMVGSIPNDTSSLENFNSPVPEISYYVSSEEHFFYPYMANPYATFGFHTDVGKNTNRYVKLPVVKIANNFSNEMIPRGQVSKDHQIPTVKLPTIDHSENKTVQDEKEIFPPPESEPEVVEEPAMSDETSAVIAIVAEENLMVTTTPNPINLNQSSNQSGVSW